MDTPTAPIHEPSEALAQIARLLVEQAEDDLEP